MGNRDAPLKNFNGWLLVFFGGSFMTGFGAAIVVITRMVVEAFGTVGDVTIYSNIQFGSLALIVLGILAAVTAVYELKKTVKPTTERPYLIAVATPTQTKYCRYCGSENKSDAIYCEKCGKVLS